MKSCKLLMCLLAVAVLSSAAMGAFIVETHSSGRGYENFNALNGEPHYSSPTAGTPGLTATHHAWGSYGSFPDVYEFSYTPGTDLDNWAVPDYQYFGNGNYTTGQTGGVTGYYNVYITFPSTSNVSSLADITVTSDADPVVLTGVNMNTGGTTTEGQPWLGGNDSWLMIAEKVLLTEGNTYTVTQAAQNDTYVSMRSAGVMWEFVEVPEPATLILLGGGALLLRRRRSA